MESPDGGDDPAEGTLDDLATLPAGPDVLSLHRRVMAGEPADDTAEQARATQEGRRRHGLDTGPHRRRGHSGRRGRLAAMHSSAFVPGAAPAGGPPSAKQCSTATAERRATPGGTAGGGADQHAASMYFTTHTFVPVGCRHRDAECGGHRDQGGTAAGRCEPSCGGPWRRTGRRTDARGAGAWARKAVSCACAARHVPRAARMDKFGDVGPVRCPGGGRSACVPCSASAYRRPAPPARRSSRPREDQHEPGGSVRQVVQRGPQPGSFSSSGTFQNSPPGEQTVAAADV